MIILKGLLVGVGLIVAMVCAYYLIKFGRWMFSEKTPKEEIPSVVSSLKENYKGDDLVTVSPGKVVEMGAKIPEEDFDEEMTNQINNLQEDVNRKYEINKYGIKWGRNEYGEDDDEDDEDDDDDDDDSLSGRFNLFGAIFALIPAVVIVAITIMVGSSLLSELEEIREGTESQTTHLISNATGHAHRTSSANVTENIFLNTGVIKFGLVGIVIFMLIAGVTQAYSALRNTGMV